MKKMPAAVPNTSLSRPMSLAVVSLGIPTFVRSMYATT
jgi:hypothetical protein